MNCSKCLNNIEGNETYCPHCGAKINDNYKSQIHSLNTGTGHKLRDVSAIIGFVFGICTMSHFLLFLLVAASSYDDGIVFIFLTLMVGVPGIIFSAMGAKSYFYSIKAKFGLIISTVDVAIVIIIFILLALQYA